MENEITKRRTKWKYVFGISVLFQCGLLLGLYGIYLGGQVSLSGLTPTTSDEGKEMIKGGMDIALQSLLAGITSFSAGSFLMILSRHKLEETK
ncbi:MAG: hypothetical protein QM496_05635 [Verrucomicrobiota bacterium]